MSEQLFSAEPEVAFLSIILKNPDLVFNNLSVKPFMMSSTPHQILLDCFLQLGSKNLLPEVNLVENHLISNAKLASAGGTEYLKYLYSQNAPKENLKGFETLIINAYKARSLLSISANIPNLVANKSPEEAISVLKNQIDHLNLTSGGESTNVISSLLKEGWEEIVNRVNNPGLVGNPFGIKNIDIITGGVGLGDLWVIAGRPSMGKSAILCNSVLNTALQNKRPLVFSLEMNKQTLVERIIAIFSKLSISNIRLGNLSKSDLELISDTIKKIKNLPIFIDTNYQMDIYYVESTIKKYKKLHDIDIIYLDYLQLLVERDESSTNELGKVTRRIKLVSNDLGISSVILSQINRDVERRDDKRPVLSDLRQSGNIEEDADLVAFLYRDVYYNKSTDQKDLLEFIIRKHRNGAIGTIPLKFNEESNFITDV